MARVGKNHFKLLGPRWSVWIKLELVQMIGASTFRMEEHASAQVTVLELVAWTNSPGADSTSHAQAHMDTLELK